MAARGLGREKRCPDLRQSLIGSVEIAGITDIFEILFEPLPDCLEVLIDYQRLRWAKISAVFLPIRAT